MIEIEMTRNIKEREPKIIWGLTARQLKCAGIAMSYGLPMLMFLPFNFYVRLIVVLTLVIPTFLCGSQKVYGMYLNEFIKNIIKTRLYPKKRKYVSDTVIDIKNSYNEPVNKVMRSKDIRRVS